MQHVPTIILLWVKQHALTKKGTTLDVPLALVQVHCLTYLWYDDQLTVFT